MAVVQHRWRPRSWLARAWLRTGIQGSGEDLCRNAATVNCIWDDPISWPIKWGESRVSDVAGARTANLGGELVTALTGAGRTLGAGAKTTAGVITAWISSGSGGLPAAFACVSAGSGEAA